MNFVNAACLLQFRFQFPVSKKFGEANKRPACADDRCCFAYFRHGVVTIDSDAGLHKRDPNPDPFSFYLHLPSLWPARLYFTVSRSHLSTSVGWSGCCGCK